MANIPADLLYTADHEYVKATDDSSVVQVGITDYAQDQLGDVVFVELPKKGAKFGAHDVFGTIEAVKAVSELFCPLAGEVVEVNDRLDGEPALVNSDPYGAGWMIKLRVTGDKSGLLSADDYSKQIG
ncbi:MAG TPA: glycine cleavage system protein GcvH [Gemmatimonadaceae bacterium]